MLQNTRKTKPERKEPPMFHTIVEMHSRDQWVVYSNVADSVNALLAGKTARAQLRRQLNGKIVIKMHDPSGQGDVKTASLDADSWIQDLYDIKQAQDKKSQSVDI